jgi:hypothetical protein
MMHLKKMPISISKVVAGSLLGALFLSLISPMPAANAATFNSSGLVLAPSSSAVE